MNKFQEAMKVLIEENCKQGVYAKRFSSKLEKTIQKKSEDLAEVALQDEDLHKALDLAIEDAIRIMIQNEE